MADLIEMRQIWESSTFTWAEVWLVLVRLAVAVVLGAAVGWEREKNRKPAGLRTHILITLSSAAFMILALELAERTKGDPARVIQGIIMGVGFLGAGAITRSKSGGESEGMTTASGIWTTTAIGIAVGAGWFVVALMTTLITVLVTWGLGVALRGRGGRGEDTPTPSAGESIVEKRRPDA